MQLLLPSPDVNSFSVGPFTFYLYALCIIAGISIAIWLGGKRYAANGGSAEEVSAAAIWAVPFGIIGGRIYHVISSPQQYFGEKGNPVDALRIWQGGLGIWGAISIGAVGGYIYFRTHKTSLSFTHFLDALAPGVLIAQAIGRVGNWFNQELFGRPTTLPWGLEIDLKNRPDGYESFLTFHPTFLYEALWCLLIATLLINLPRFLKAIVKNTGDLFVLYVFGYTLGRLWIEAIRIDSANYILGLRLNIWVSLVVLIISALYLMRSNRRGSVSKSIPSS